MSSNWDLQTLNWVSTLNPASAAVYQNGFPVTFDDTATGATAINLTAALTPSSVTVSNAALAYSISGSGQMSGAMALTKNGAGTLILGSANNFTGGVAINAGDPANQQRLVRGHWHHHQ